MMEDSSLIVDHVRVTLGGSAPCHVVLFPENTALLLPNRMAAPHAVGEWTDALTGQPEGARDEAPARETSASGGGQYEVLAVAMVAKPDAVPDCRTFPSRSMATVIAPTELTICADT